VAWANDLSPSQRVTQASQKASKLIDACTSLLQVHATNQIVFYTDTLSKQIPMSYAAHAFNAFQNAHLHYEVLRVCALWDPAKANRLSIPTITCLLNDVATRCELDRRIAASWQSIGAHTEFETQQVRKIGGWLNSSLQLATRIQRSQRLRELRNFRDKFLAHNLEHSWDEQGGAVIAAPKLGFERKLLSVSVKLVWRLYLATANTDFDFESARRQAFRNARELWDACHFVLAARTPAEGGRAGIQMA
jgi:hypothetical protein